MVNINFINLAYSYTHKSDHISSVSEIKIDEANKKASFTATFVLKFPSAITDKETKFGVRQKEPVTFEFSEQFPLKAPFITLRKDFPRVFEHINPNKDVVNPCIYEGDLNELLQQPGFFDEVLDQMATWLDKTTTNSLFNRDQGWEPMRSDELHGIIEYPTSVVEEFINTGINIAGISYKFKKEKFKVTIEEYKPESLNNTDTSALIPFISEDIAEQYYPNSINIYQDLVDFCKKVHIPDLDKYLVEHYKVLQRLSFVFVTLFVKRPAKVIGTNLDCEIMNFAINVKTLKITKTAAKIQYGAKVYTLGTIECPSKNLLAKFSGLSTKNIKKGMTITQIGCGSLGSKIIMHLGRTGITDNINLIDNGVFSAHNHARHALCNTKYLLSNYKSELLFAALSEMGLENVRHSENDIKDIKKLIKENQVLIDSTADISVRNFLVDDEIKSEVIYTVLHNLGTVGLVFIEGKDRNVRIDDIVIEFYLLCFHNDTLSQLICTSNVQYQTVGQGCGSLTTIVSDATISLQASAMANIIQKRLENGSSELGELYIGSIENNININWQSLNINTPMILHDDTYDMQVRISPRVVNKIKEESSIHFPNETGGVLIGHISLINKTFTIVELIDAPADSTRSPGYFKLGTLGLLENIANYEERTNGLLTYIGTWHSHPQGGGASRTDFNMKNKLIKDREDFPSVCLIYSQKKFLTY
ncbi:Mov34/MPN/PAD-1 family protein [Arcobacter sp. F2176]|uniref:Mov34/MPN/PAD-1 family protein n=1 Tax=Arcobacter sp. F2176 TaxID=2044511 RepID=UPI00100BA5E7|nr:ThiF family adenylyltransferase [Arcobacter sp. F2176]RXJ79340.1 hypothetical protein CRU95_14475 [Arcobacter sp. F2176]